MRVSFSLWPIRSTAEPAHGMWWLFRIAVPDDFLGQDRCVVIDAQDEFLRIGMNWDQPWPPANIRPIGLTFTPS